MCCQARWKREVVLDHKFDFVNTREFHTNSFSIRLRYVGIYILLLKSFVVYCLDIFTAVTMLATDHWTNSIQQKCTDTCVINIPFNTAKWIFVGCIIFSFLLLAYETYKTRQVIKSRDISSAFTNVMANDYYSFKSYDNFCFFCQINNSTKKKDDFAFFVFFQFKDWKRLILADGPRQSINALILYSFAKANGFQTNNLPAYWDNSISVLLLLLAMLATLLIFACSMVLLIAAGVFYIPLLCYIQGNLKEYCCHKIDKRIAELIRRKQRQRVAENIAIEKKLAQGDQIRNKKGELVSAIAQPTLPTVAFDHLDDDMQMKTRSGTRGPSRSKSDRSLNSAWSYEKYDAWPPADTMPNYQGMPPPTMPYEGGVPGYPMYSRHNTGRSVDTFAGQQSLYGSSYSQEPYGSSTNLIAGEAPLGMSYSDSNLASYASAQLAGPYPPTAYHDSFDTQTDLPRQPPYATPSPFAQPSNNSIHRPNVARQIYTPPAESLETRRPSSGVSSGDGSSISGNGLAPDYYMSDQQSRLPLEAPYESTGAVRSQSRQYSNDNHPDNRVPMRAPSVGDYRPKGSRQQWQS